jgi:hypothetical protein
MRRVVSSSSFALVVRIRKLPVCLHSSIEYSLWASLVRVEHVFVLIHVNHLLVDW